MPSSTDRIDSSILDHPRREKIFRVVQENPGLNWNQLQRETGLSVGALLFHLDKLEENDAVLRREATNENEVLFFTPDNEDLWRDPSTRVLFGNESTRRVARVITENPGVSVKAIADEVGVHPVTVRYHLDKLDEHKLVLSDKEGRANVYFPTDRLSEWMDQVGRY